MSSSSLRPLRTGGPLNWLNEKFHLNSRASSVSVMQLVRCHNPKSPRELEDLIEEHFKGTCSCGLTSKGTVKMFAQKLFEAQQQPVYVEKYPRDKHSVERCYGFMFDLFCVSPIRGTEFELKALNVLMKAVRTVTQESSIQVRRATTDEDFGGIDLVIEKTESEIPLIGIQVKPVSFKYSREGAQKIMKQKLKNFNFECCYLYYTPEGDWVNINEVMEILNNMMTNCSASFHVLA